MDFLSKVSAKAEETIQTIKESEVTKKAKNYAEIPGLQIQVGKCENLVRKAYEEIGAAYYKAHKDEEQDEFAVPFSVIRENLSKIGQLKAEIEEKKSGEEPAAEAEIHSEEKICPICGRCMAGDAAFCSVCGHQF